MAWGEKILGKERNKGLEGGSHILTVCWSVGLSGLALHLISTVCPVFSFKSIFIFLGARFSSVYKEVREGSNWSETMGSQEPLSMMLATGVLVCE